SKTSSGLSSTDTVVVKLSGRVGAGAMSCSFGLDRWSNAIVRPGGIADIGSGLRHFPSPTTYLAGAAEVATYRRLISEEAQFVKGCRRLRWQFLVQQER
ncbi:MAG: hypothetical protein ACRDVP_07740, partial [Acidimicrobiales bacterium]